LPESHSVNRPARCNISGFAALVGAASLEMDQLFKTRGKKNAQMKITTGSTCGLTLPTKQLDFSIVHVGL
jgi:hypothetical protein